jgi:hypothetical protein
MPAWLSEVETSCLAVRLSAISFLRSSEKDTAPIPHALSLPNPERDKTLRPFLLFVGHISIRLNNHYSDPFRNTSSA